MNFSSSQTNPFPRYGAAINALASKEGDIYMMGGLIDGSTVKGDLWVMESSGGNLSCLPIATVSEGPGPRVGHASLLVGNAFIVFGGDTKVDESDTLDDTLYLLNTCMYMCPAPLNSGFSEAPHANVTESQLLVNGRDPYLQVPDPPGVTVTLSTYLVLGFMFLVGRSKVTFLTTWWPLTSTSSRTPRTSGSS
ncbi:hypothetical protein BO78DRAFT_57535 [Aspergillus sclerotiicarbonarius CBS 121057]|uniref:Galactose oxidase n=1 Tax=Aspergillus sclerotiicarbonarius (strain CBS 121057 / IBT 28362) TaxID=1448318 RepID=A0A319EWC6_ASPSB|nr:hypothetical protein BO78DRAFT_57535 [Aspergillus sclerotiicarbonarius CBS 121057]